MRLDTKITLRIESAFSLGLKTMYCVYEDLYYQQSDGAVTPLLLTLSLI